MLASGQHPSTDWHSVKAFDARRTFDSWTWFCKDASHAEVEQICCLHHVVLTGHAETEHAGTSKDSLPQSNVCKPHIELIPMALV